MADKPKTSENVNKTEEKSKVEAVKTDPTKKDIPKEPDKKTVDKTADIPKTPTDKAVDKKEPVKTAEATKPPTDKAVDSKEPVKTTEATKPTTDKAVDSKEPVKTAEATKPPTDKAVDNKEPVKTAEAPKGPANKTAEKTAKVIDFNPTAKGKTAETTAKTADVKQPEKEAEQPPKPLEVPRKGEKEEIVLLNPNELHAFKNHPFQVREDDEMRAMVESVKDKGVTQPLIVRPLEDGGYEIISGHRRQKASELAGYTEIPCIVRNLSDDEAVTQRYQLMSIYHCSIKIISRGKGKTVYFTVEWMEIL